MFTLPCSVQLEETDCRKLAVFPWATTTLLFWQTNSYGCSRGFRLTLPVLKLLDRTSLFFVPSECLSPKICCSWSSDNFAKRAHCVFFFSALFFLLVGSGAKKSTSIEKLGSSSLVSSREGKLRCSLTGRPLCSQVKKMLTSSYLRTGVRN